MRQWHFVALAEIHDGQCDIGKHRSVCLHTSKVIRSIEEKELIVRNLGIRINGRCILLYPIKGVNVWKR